MAWIVAVAVTAGLAAGCGVRGLSFVEDDRVSITSPDDRATVRMPVTVSWTVEDFAGSFAVFVDRAPMPPGRSLAWLTRDDDLCNNTPGCPDEAYLAGLGAYRTSATSLTIDQVTPLRDEAGEELHDVTIVLLDEDGKRIGESAFQVEFEVEDQQ